MGDTAKVLDRRADIQERKIELELQKQKQIEEARKLRERKAELKQKELEAKEERAKALLQSQLSRAQIDREIELEKLRKLKLDRRIKQGKYIAKHKVEEYFDKTYGNYKNLLLALPRVAAIKIAPDEPEKVEEILQQEIDGILTQLDNPLETAEEDEDDTKHSFVIEE